MVMAWITQLLTGLSTGDVWRCSCHTRGSGPWRIQGAGVMDTVSSTDLQSWYERFQVKQF